MSETQSLDCCAMCRGGLHAGTTTFTADLGFGVVVVRDVPAEVCGQCGADWLSDATAERLEGLVERARDNHAQVEVLEYS